MNTAHAGSLGYKFPEGNHIQVLIGDSSYVLLVGILLHYQKFFHVITRYRHLSFNSLYR